MNQAKIKFEFFDEHLAQVEPGTVFVEIGGERGEGSTAYLSSLAKQHHSRLISVDIELPQDKQQALLAAQWQEFYRTVRDQSWPDAVDSIDQLPLLLQHECTTVHGWDQVRQQLLTNFEFADNTQVICAVGSDWSRRYAELHGEKISLLYLDNFDYIWNVSAVPEFIQQQILLYRTQHNIDMNNQNCQVEHLTQLVNLYPFLSEHSVVGFDDTFQINDCWAGKSGPGVVYLLSQGWKIAHNSNGFVIMSRT